VLLKVSLEGPGASSEALTELARLASAKLKIDPPPGPLAADGIHELRAGPAEVTELFNVVTRFLLDRPADLVVVLRGEAGQQAQLDRETVSSPLALLAALVLFNPPVGLG
jgi:hypothetical protein